MKIFTRILAVVVITISILSVLLTLTGVVGIWRANGPLTDSLEQLALFAENSLEIVNTAYKRSIQSSAS